MNPADSQNNFNPVLNSPPSTGFPPQDDQQPSPFTPPVDTTAALPLQQTADPASASSFSSSPAVPQPAQNEQVASPEVVTTSSQPPAGSGKRKILAALGIVVMLLGIGAGVYAFRSYQAGGASAWDCSLYVSSLQPNGNLIVTNGSSRDEPAATGHIFINGTEVTTVNVPALSAGEGVTLQTNVSLPVNESYTWRVQIAECVNSGSHEVDTVSAECSEVIAYDENWAALSAGALADLSEGDIVRFAVQGTATSGTFDMARFSVNGAAAIEVVDTKPGSEEFYYEYTIPAGVDSFSVSAQIHHSELGWF